MKTALPCLLLLLGGCKEQPPPGPTPEQAAQLNEAENMLDAESPKEKGPGDRSPGPSNSSD
jgi:hypothetical protein